MKTILFTVLIFIFLASNSFGGQLNKNLSNLIEQAKKQIHTISEERKAVLEEIGNYIIQSLEKNDSAKLLYVCTHNSRRSQMSQMMAMAVSEYYGVDGINAYSGGTETTALNPRAAAALKRVGFEIKETGQKNEINKIYEASYSENKKPVILFSKVYDDDFNPKENFAATMVCSHADETCPIVYGADKRILLPYDDPKAFDGTPQEAQKYDERLFQITTEISYLFQNIKSKL